MLENKVQMRNGEVKTIIRATVSIDSKSIDQCKHYKLMNEQHFLQCFLSNCSDKK